MSNFDSPLCTQKAGQNRDKTPKIKKKARFSIEKQAKIGNLGGH